MLDFNTLIFDLDGTLINSEKFHYDCWNRVLLPCGITLQFDDYIKTYAGVYIQTNAERIIERFELKIQGGELVHRRESLAKQRLCSEGIRLMPHALKVLRHLKMAGKPMFLVTGSPRRLVDHVMAKTRLGELFVFSVTNDDVTLSKPHPECYQKAFVMSGITPEKMLVFEDTESGVKAAKRAGLACFAIQSDPIMKAWVQAADRVFEDLYLALNT